MLPVIKRIRRDARVSQEKLALDMDRKVLTIKRWEKGLSEPPFSLICRVLKKYGLNVLRYTFSEDDLKEICDRGFGDYALKLEQGHFISYETLLALNDRDWAMVEKIRSDNFADKIVSEIFDKVSDPVSWGKDAQEAASSAYSYYEDERWEGLAEAQAILKLKQKFQPFFLLP